jgi:hypothetical protein
VRAKSATPTEEWAPKFTEVIRGFFTRQGKVVLAELGTKDPDWWDGERWDRELAADLLTVSMAAGLSTLYGSAQDNGYPTEDYPPGRMRPYLVALTNGRARAINATTLAQLEASDTPAQVFETAENARSLSASGAIAAAVTSFAVVEFAKTYLPGGATKTWITGGNPRAAHAAMNGETVGIEDTFSNGAQWPGDAALDVGDTAGCNCGIETSF